MTEFQIESETRERKYDSEEYGRALLTVEVEDFFPQLDSWDYEEPFEYEGLTGRTREMPADFRGQDLTWCTVSLHAEFGAVQKKKFVSLRRGLRRGRSSIDETDVVYESSACVSNNTGIFIKTDEENVIDPISSDSEMMWELASDAPFTLEDNLDRLIEEAHRLFEPKVPVHI